MINPPRPEGSENDLVRWLVTALQGHVPSREIQLAMVSRFGLTDDEARIALESACDGILRAISGSRSSMPNAETDPIGNAAFELVWDTFNQNSFFDKRRTPDRQWLDWKEQQRYQPFD